jgi:uncharacterized protein YggE
MESNNFFSKQYVQVLVGLVLLAVLVALGAYANLALKQARGTFTGDATISVNGTGEVLAKPDIGQFSFSVQADGVTATEAQDKSATAINTIMNYLKEAGVAEEDIKTDNYALNPKYRYDERLCPFNVYCPPSEPVIDGYQVSQTVSVKVRNLESAGTLITGAGERGATNISGLNFTIDDETALKAEAREKAIADAREKAEQLAADLGMRVNRITSFYEQDGGFYPVPMYAKGGDMAVAESMNAPAVPALPTGQNTIMSTVTLTFELR